MSLISKANRLGGHPGDVKHWEYEWTSSAKQNENGSDEKVKYKYKQWVQQGNSWRNANEDDSDVLNITDFDRTKVKKIVRTLEKTGPDSLSINDIRGAVGGSDIPGFSGSDAKKEAELQDAAQDTPVDATPTESSVQVDETDQTPGATPLGSYEVKDSEGDVPMK